MKSTPHIPFFALVILASLASAHAQERASKSFSGETDDSKQHGSVTLTIEQGNKYGTAFAAGLQGYRAPVVYRRDTLLTEIVAEPIPGKESEFLGLLVEGLGLAPAVANKVKLLIYRHAHVDEYFTNDQMVPAEAETCNVIGENGTVLVQAYVPGAGYLKGGAVGSEIAGWRNSGGVTGLYSEIEWERDRPNREKREAKERVERERREAKEREQRAKEEAKRQREEAKRKAEEEKRKAREEAEALKRAEKESKKQ